MIQLGRTGPLTCKGYPALSGWRGQGTLSKSSIQLGSVKWSPSSQRWSGCKFQEQVRRKSGRPKSHSFTRRVVLEHCSFSLSISLQSSLGLFQLELIHSHCLVDTKCPFLLCSLYEISVGSSWRNPLGCSTLP